ncbi:MAG TPA: substrate-binding domain-containing protein [Verrucomicrobiae bacterium]|nr:substrate-binding domain-containing protein [Verrucomicrobiae bacterium]
MCFLFRCLLLWAFTAGAADTLRIAADPNNLPFSNDKGEGFENKIAQVIARDLQMQIEYRWRAQRRGFFRETLKEGDCDLVLGVPTGFERALTTKPYYRASYVLVYRKDRGIALKSLDDPDLRTLPVGVQLIGDDGANTPPAHALAARNIVTNIVGFTVYGDYSQPNPPLRILDAVVNRQIDVAVVWGPPAGYFAKKHEGALEIVPLGADTRLEWLPMTFNISIGVKRSKKELRDKLNAVLERRRPEIEQILEEYGIPRAH